MSEICSRPFASALRQAAYLGVVRKVISLHLDCGYFLAFNFVNARQTIVAGPANDFGGSPGLCLE